MKRKGTYGFRRVLFPLPAAFALLCAVAVHGDRIYLKDGTRLDGFIKEVHGTTIRALVFREDELVQESIPGDRIESYRLSEGKELEVLKENLERVEGIPYRITDMETKKEDSILLWVYVRPGRSKKSLAALAEKLREKYDTRERFELRIVDDMLLADPVHREKLSVYHPVTYKEKLWDHYLYQVLRNEETKGKTRSRYKPLG